MASSTKAATAKIGSTTWIQYEREEAQRLVAQEVEEFGFNVRNEMEWLNEHMADVFTTNQINFADVFKTPGKLRGKTPGTTRKFDALAPRQPLTDIFTANSAQAPTPGQKTAFYEKIAQFKIAEDNENQAPLVQSEQNVKSPPRAGKVYMDSGYHGMTEDEMDTDMPPASIDASSQGTQTQQTTQPFDTQPDIQPVRDSKPDETGASDDSFVSAEEQKVDPVQVADTRIDKARNAEVEMVAHEAQADVQPADEPVAPPQLDEVIMLDDDVDSTPMSPRSDGSSPTKPLQRKSSFSFSALPAREPFGTKKSMGQAENVRTSAFAKPLLAASASQEDMKIDQVAADKPQESRPQAKTSTQLLQERISLLGKTKELRLSKTITSSNSQTAQVVYPSLPLPSQSAEPANEAVIPEITTKKDAGLDEADWIAPVKSNVASFMAKSGAANSSLPFSHHKSMSTTDIRSPRTNMASEIRHQKALSVTQNLFSEPAQSTTPAGSPLAKSKEGPLSASKNRLWSALKSAKNIFASSASASAAAKLEAHNTSPSIKAAASRDHLDDLPANGVFNMPGALYSEKQLPKSPSRPISLLSRSPSRKTRSSSESERKREQELKNQQKAADMLEKAREQEAQVAAKQQEKRLKTEQRSQTANIHADRPESSHSDMSAKTDMAPPPAPAPTKAGAGKLKALSKSTKPGKDTTSKPAPVSIRITSQAQRFGQSQTALGRSQHESSTPATATRDAISRAPSAQSIRGGATATSNARVKALEAAARKKEADEKAAQKKLEQKKELERKRAAAKAEEEKRQEEERKAAEQHRLQAAQRKAEKQAAEAKKREQERAEQQRREQERQEQLKQEQERREQERIEQQRREQERLEQQRRDAEQARQLEEARKARETQELAEAIKRERAQQAQQAQPRADLPGTLRQLAKNVLAIPTNPAKPAKRPLLAEETESTVSRPGIQRGPPSYQQTDAKRRRTNEENEDNAERHSVMAPPRRPSTMRKDTLGKHPYGFTPAMSGTAHPASIFKSAVAAQQKLGLSHPSQMAQVSNARIPFAENNNPPAPVATYQSLASSLHSYENAHSSGAPSKFKTPARPAYGQPKSAKSTPSYPNGDNIELPDIATDSEDEDDDDDGPSGFRAPSWVASPALRELLTQQQLVDPETVFGPIAELKMDEVFKNSKNQERLKRFRDRGSSALWVETGDAVTSAEKKRDREIRERVARDGGWRYDPGAA